DPLLYHLVINTGKVSIDQAVEIITRLVVENVKPKASAEQVVPAEQEVPAKQKAESEGR
ncbi:MAG: hypothetical protein IH586_22880, partial [Anaerolineaceae bacterium]|nr:hypothetical protein [Anaerolineaceae bacterium]